VVPKRGRASVWDFAPHGSQDAAVFDFGGYGRRNGAT
jgi:hypothetical protein